MLLIVRVCHFRAHLTFSADSALQNCINAFDVILTVFFTLELLVNLCGHGLQFFTEAFNVYDFFVVIVSLVRIAAIPCKLLQGRPRAYSHVSFYENE